MLLLWWAVMITAFVIGVCADSVLLVVIPFLASFVLAICSAIRAQPGVLRFRALYYGLVGTLLATSATTLVAAGSTLFIAPGTSLRVVGFTALGLVNMVVGVLTWRALVRPAPRRAAVAGMLAVLGEMFALIVDIVMNDRMPGFERGSEWIEVALWGSLISMASGCLACIAALAAFRDVDAHEIPEAQIVKD